MTNETQHDSDPEDEIAALDDEELSEQLSDHDREIGGESDASSMISLVETSDDEGESTSDHAHTSEASSDEQSEDSRLLLLWG